MNLLNIFSFEKSKIIIGFKFDQKQIVYLLDFFAYVFILTMLSTRGFLSVIAMYSEELVLNILALSSIIYQTFFHAILLLFSSELCICKLH